MSNDLVPRGEQPMELSVEGLKAQVKKIQTVMAEVMQKGEHYGTIPGTEKPTLLKAGAEKLNLTFRLSPTYKIDRRDLPGNHREYDIICTLTHIPTGLIVGQGVGSCSTMESRYRWRRGEAESTGKPVPGEYWKTRNANLLGGKDFVPRKIEGVWLICKKSEERNENPDIADTYNTVLKIAKKRAQVDAVLTATAASDIFTQDMEDGGEHDSEEPSPAAAQPSGASWTDTHSQAPKPARAVLWDSLCDWTNGDKGQATELLKDLTGKTSIGQLSEAEAITAQRKFKLEYVEKSPPGETLPGTEEKLPGTEQNKG